MTTYKFTLQTLTPLHIGNGEELRKDFDYAVFGEGTWRLNTDLIWDKKYKEGGNPIPGKLLTEKDFRESRWFRYVVKGKPRSDKTDARIKACIKDAYDCPYVPGSSIKGAIRTVLAKRAVRDRKLKLYPSIDMTSTSRSALKSKDDRIERELFGLGANREAREFPREDIFRAIQVSDATMPAENRKPGSGMEIVNATPISRRPSANGASVPIELEAIQRKQEFEGTIKIDDFLLNGIFADRSAIFKDWLGTLRDSGYARLEWLIDWFQGVGNSELIDKDLSSMMSKVKKRLNDYPHALIQIGGGTGWDGMTYGKRLQDEDSYRFETMLKELKILRSTRGGFPQRKMDELFPSSKKVVQNPAAGWKPASLLGWCLLLFEKTESSK